MFDISWSEFAIIAVVALIAIGPKELPGVLRMVGQWMGKARKMAAEFQGQFQEAMREAEMADLKKSFDEVKEAATGFASGNVMTSLQNDVTSALKIDDVDKPVTTSVEASLGEASTAAPAEMTAASAEAPEQPTISPETPPHLAAPETGSADVEVEAPRDAKAS
jgi:sec-independent protein translocase protein TatB